MWEGRVEINYESGRYSELKLDNNLQEKTITKPIYIYTVDGKTEEKRKQTG